MLIHHGATSGSPHSAPLGGPLGSHITLGHGSLPESCRDVGGSFSGRSGDAALPLVCLCLPRARYSRSDLNICKCCCGPPRHQRETPTSSSNPASQPAPPPSSTLTHTHIRAHHPSPFIFLAPFPFFVSGWAAASSAVWADGCGNQICFVTQIYFKEEWDC